MAAPVVAADPEGRRTVAPASYTAVDFADALADAAKNGGYVLLTNPNELKMDREFVITGRCEGVVGLATRTQTGRTSWSNRYPSLTTYKDPAAGKRVGLLVKDVAEGVRVTVKGLQFQMEAATYEHQGAAVYVAGVKLVTLDTIEVRRLAKGRGIHLRGDCSGAVLKDITVEVDLQTEGVSKAALTAPGILGISVDSTRDESVVNRTAWQNTHDVPAYDHVTDGVVFENCRSSYVYYGFDLNGVKNARFTGCVARLCMRGYSIQNRCEGVRLYKCQSNESTSAGFHIAYRCRDVYAQKCSVTMGQNSHGEGCYQAYVGCEDVTFDDCATSGHGLPPTAGNKYHCYTAVGCKRIVFRGMRLSGPALRSYIGIESGWNSTLTRKNHRNYGVDPKDDTLNSFGMGDIRVENCTVTPAAGVESHVHGVLVAAVKSKAGEPLPLYGVRLTGLTVGDGIVPVAVYRDAALGLTVG